jgi:hypothetical protein
MRYGSVCNANCYSMLIAIQKERSKTGGSRAGTGVRGGDFATVLFAAPDLSSVSPLSILVLVSHCAQCGAHASTTHATRCHRRTRWNHLLHGPRWSTVPGHDSAALWTCDGDLSGRGLRHRYPLTLTSTHSLHIHLAQHRHLISWTLGTDTHTGT